MKNHIKFCDQNRRLSRSELRDKGYIRGPRLLQNPSVRRIKYIMAEWSHKSVAESPLAYEMMKLDLYNQQEAGCKKDCANCPGQKEFKCDSEQERLKRLEVRALVLQDEGYMAAHVPPQAHGIIHGYRTNFNIIRSLIEYMSERGLMKDMLMTKIGLAEIPAQLAQQFIQRKIDEILKDAEDEKTSQVRSSPE